MNSQPNWNSLYEQGRCKAYGVPWSAAELHALYELKIPVEFVRNGCLTVEDMEKDKRMITRHEKSKGEKPLIYMTKEDLMKMAIQMGIEVTESVKRFDLIHLIKVERTKSESKLPAGDAVSSES